MKARSRNQGILLEERVLLCPGPIVGVQSIYTSTPMVDDMEE